MKKPNIYISNSEPFTCDIESIHLASWIKYYTYDSILYNVKDGKKPSSLLVYIVVARKITYEENDFKGEIVNIYQNPQALINYIIDTFSNEGD